MQVKSVHLCEVQDCSPSKETSISNVTSQAKASSLTVHVKQEPDAQRSIQYFKHSTSTVDKKPNLLKLLNQQNISAKNGEAFKKIGNRIVVPLNFPLSMKKGNALKEKQSINLKSEVPFPSIQNNIPARTVLKTVTLSRFQLGEEIKKPCFKSTVILPNIKSKTETGCHGDLNAKLRQNGNWKPLTTSAQPGLQFTTRCKAEDKKSSKISSKANLSVHGEDDNELTCLSWLSNKKNKQLMDTIRKCNPDDPGIGMSGDEKENEENISSYHTFLATSPIKSKKTPLSQDSNYDPTAKPPYSFSCLIFMAIEDSYLKRLQVKDIYSWICRHFPYFETAQSSWKNSIRHNLSLNKCFKKFEDSHDNAKSSLWSIDPAYRPNLVQALKRSPFYPYLPTAAVGQPLSLSNLANLLPGAHTGRVPSWSPAMSPSTVCADADMTSAALNLMGLRGSDSETDTSKCSESVSNTLEEILRDAKWMISEDKSIQEIESNALDDFEPVVIRGSNQDHLYACIASKKKISSEEIRRCQSPDSEKSAPDAAYEFETVGFSEDELNEVMIADILDEIVINEDETDEEDHELFDSGFGSIKSFDVKKDKHACKHKLEQSEKEPSSKLKKDRCFTRNSSEISRYSSSDFVKSQPKSVKTKGRNRRQIKGHTRKQRSGEQKSNVKKLVKEKKNSDVDSGKDSPKADRTAKSKRSRHRSHKDRISSQRTRSSGCKVLTQEAEKKKKHISSSDKRKRQLSSRSEVSDEEEEIKRAAGSLLHLAGLFKPSDSQVGITTR